MSNPENKTTDSTSGDTARRGEATSDTATVEFRGHTFTVPRDLDDMSVDFMESVEEGKTVGIVRGALGPRQWRQVRTMNLTMRELAPLADKIAAALGFADSGESPASSA